MVEYSALAEGLQACSPCTLSATILQSRQSLRCSSVAAVACTAAGEQQDGGQAQPGTHVAQAMQQAARSHAEQVVTLLVEQASPFSKLGQQSSGSAAQLTFEHLGAAA